MRLLVFGASGATGRQLVMQALAADHAVTAFVRDATKLGISHPLLKTVQGDAGDYAPVAGAVVGQEAVVSALGVNAPLRHDPIVIDGVRHIIRAMTETGVQRLVYLSFIGVRDSRAAAGFVVRHIAVLPLRHEIRDHESKEELVTASQLAWTIVRAPTLTNGPATGAFRIGTDIAARSLLPTLSRADVAACLLRQAADRTFVRAVLRVLP